MFLSTWPRWWSSCLHFPYSWGDGVPHHVQLLAKMRSQEHFCSGWPWTMILQISASHVAGITRMTHHTWSALASGRCLVLASSSLSDDVSELCFGLHECCLVAAHLCCEGALIRTPAVLGDRCSVFVDLGSCEVVRSSQHHSFSHFWWTYKCC
jgi:hypothetical protein